MKNLAGKIIISPPSVRGNYWQKTTVFITENHGSGSVGLILNRASQMTIKEFASQHNLDLDIQGYVHVGGPVNVKALTILHSSEWACSNTMRINEDFSLSSSHDLLTRLAMHDRPRYWRMFVGLCGWQKDQLENEIRGIHPFEKKHSWLTVSANHNLVFKHDSANQWTEAIEQAGIEFAQSVLV